MKEKKRLKTIKRIQNLSITLDCNLFEIIPEDVMTQLSPNFSRPPIGFKPPSTNPVDINRNKVTN